jgi:hypothetical protein
VEKLSKAFLFDIKISRERYNSFEIKANHHAMGYYYDNCNICVERAEQFKQQQFVLNGLGLFRAIISGL